MNSNVRKSNMELLRIISMSMVVAIHLNGAWTYANGYGSFDFTSLHGFSLMLYQAFIIVAVNCFILISGYFGIKPSKKGICSFLAYIIFYALLCFGIGNLIDTTDFSFRKLAACFFHIDKQLWFVSTYLILYLLSHFINKGINALSNKKLILITLIFTSLDILGWVKGGSLLFGSYQINHMLTVYIIGRTLARFKDRILPISKKSKSILLALFITCSFATALLTIRFKYVFPMDYNSIFTLTASVAFFILFMSLNLQNRIINFIAGSAFSVYLLHQSSYTWSTLLNFSQSMMNSLNEWTYNFVYIPITIILLFAVTIPIDIVRRKVTNPFIKWAVKAINYLENIICKFFKIND